VTGLEETSACRLVFAGVDSGKTAAGVFPAEDATVVQVVEDLFLDVGFENGRWRLVAHPYLAARVGN